MDEKSKLLELKKKLSEEILKENSDNNLVISLSNEIANLDNSAIRFSVDAGIINRLGKELVGRQETAVSELIKNSYDADATIVNLIFENAWNKGGTLIIEDDGHGMSREQLVNGFMRLSSSDKIHNPISEKYKRQKAGKKGIGRFATQRLGNKLTIITQTVQSQKALKVIINWDDFETDKNLLTISNSIESISKTKSNGTILIIEGLREGWSDAMIKRIYRYTSELLQPFPLSKKKKEEKLNSIDKGFKSNYYRNDNGNLVVIVDEEKAIFQHALAEIEGYVLSDGQGCWALKSDKLNFPQEVFPIGNNDKDKEDTSKPFNLIKGVHFKAYYYIFDSSLFAPGTMTFIRELLFEKGGIRLYRNGFRVLPYGEPFDDWLGLDKSNNRNIILAQHTNRNFFGFVELVDQSNNFEETSSREGIIENEYLNELVNFVYRSLISAVMKVQSLRGRKVKASQKGYKNSPSENVDNAINEMKELIIPSVNARGVSQSFSNPEEQKKKVEDIFEKIKQAREEEKAKNQELIDEVNMLRILAGLGLVIGEFVHEVQRFLPGFDADIRFLKNAVKDYKDIYERTELLEANVKSFSTYTSYFDKTISRNVHRELEPIELRDVVRNFETVISNDLKRASIEMLPTKYEGYDLFTIPMHPSEWASILFNLYTNSKKAIKRAKSQGKIFIRCGKNDKVVFLEFSDNGDGINKENEENIFNAFYTTSTISNHTADEAIALTGTGLGLKIVRDIIEFYDGEIYVSTPTDDYNTTIRIEIPKN
ncbi:ATP-binding protein [Capnocytophaga cynodegmi]|uniref:histidine kinase n=1 Tax=Capnocytophaga cynodegmi TaxID=28189 RepID=A0A0B7HRV6_9FLAO|nr:ATP-binding protein [Capnocytophaga cynodegmi]CEN41349.1 Histidine kinase [Capnocytophaga cynodegmi]CEN41665.1 Histidine kinase [Capnocytophaga cynodegmi]